MTIKVLADFHHEALYHSLHLLFERRLGFELYKQIGLDWYNEGYWMVYNHIDTANQYLGIGIAKEWDEIKKKNANMYCTFPNEKAQGGDDGIYLIPDYNRNSVYKAITLEKFKQTKFDIVISSIPDHIGRFNKLISNYQPAAKHIFQVGNNWNVSGFDVKNVLASSSMARPRADQNHVHYHQEFDLNELSREACPNPKSVLNMMHLMHGDGLNRFLQMKAKMPDWNWAAHGSGNLDGPIETEGIPAAFKKHGFLWHYKREGDGFGYNCMNALAAGRPIITKKSFFKGMTLDPLLINGTTCIDLDVHDEAGAIRMLRVAADDHEQWSTNTQNRFREVVDYDKEQCRIEDFISKLK